MPTPPSPSISKARIARAFDAASRPGLPYCSLRAADAGCEAGKGGDVAAGEGDDDGGSTVVGSAAAAAVDETDVAARPRSGGGGLRGGCAEPMATESDARPSAAVAAPVSLPVTSLRRLAAARSALLLCRHSSFSFAASLASAPQARTHSPSPAPDTEGGAFLDQFVDGNVAEDGGGGGESDMCSDFVTGATKIAAANSTASASAFASHGIREGRARAGSAGARRPLSGAPSSPPQASAPARPLSEAAAALALALELPPPPRFPGLSGGTASAPCCLAPAPLAPPAARTPAQSDAHALTQAHAQALYTTAAERLSVPPPSLRASSLLSGALDLSVSAKRMRGAAAKQGAPAAPLASATAAAAVAAVAPVPAPPPPPLDQASRFPRLPVFRHEVGGPSPSPLRAPYRAQVPTRSPPSPPLRCLARSLALSRRTCSSST